MLDELPVELSHFIFFKLTGKELNALSTVCKSWRTLINDNRLWKRMCEWEGIPDDNVPQEFSFEGGGEEETEKSFEGDYLLYQLCHWWNVYKFWHLRRKNWLYDTATSHNVGTKLKHVAMRGCLMAIARSNVDGAVITNLTQLNSVDDTDDSGVVDQVAQGFNVNQIEIGVGSLALIVNDFWALVYSFEGKRSVLKAFVNLIDCRLEDLSTESVKTQEENLFIAQILIIVKHSVWIKTAKKHILVLYRSEESESESDRELNEIKLLDVAAVSTDEKNVGVLRPECIQVHDLNGKQLFTINRPGYYSGLTMNCGRLAYLCSENFDGPLPHVYDVQTRSFLDLPKEWPYEVYKLALAYKGRLLLCFHKVNLTCFTLDGPPSGGWRPMWDIVVGGSMYIRSGKSLMEVVCNRVVLFCPGIGRMNDTFHVGLMTGQMMTNKSRQDCFYAEGLVRVSHSGAVARSFDKTSDSFILRNYTT